MVAKARCARAITAASARALLLQDRFAQRFECSANWVTPSRPTMVSAPWTWCKWVRQERAGSARRQQRTGPTPGQRAPAQVDLVLDQLSGPTSNWVTAVMGQLSQLFGTGDQSTLKPATELLSSVARPASSPTAVMSVPLCVPAVVCSMQDVLHLAGDNRSPNQLGGASPRKYSRSAR